MAPSSRRVRRAPAEARSHIIEAACVVFQRALPDAVGLREIADEAGISHGLITHYFGTYEHLVDEVVESRLAAMRTTMYARLGEATFSSDDAPLLDALLDFLDDVALTRLLAWSLLGGRPERVVRARGMLRVLIDAIASRLAARGIAHDRGRLEFAVIAAISMICGWSVCRGALERGVDREIPRSEVRSELRTMLRLYVGGEPWRP